MWGAKDPAIKLFGTTIQLTEIQARSEDSMGVITNSSSGPALVNNDNGSNYASSTNSSADECHGRSGSPDIYKDLGERTTDSKIEDGGPTISSEEIMNPDVGSSIEENSSSPSFEDTSASKSSKTLEEQKEMNDSQDKTPKKPDKILPCPRCNSMETKFCYYNNYNVNQPRHFCKNCQRYWTAGGTMRNVPIGAGRRKNKASASHHHQLAVTENFQNPQTGLSNSKHPSLEPNSMVLTFGTHTPLWESTASVLNVAEKSMQDCIRNGFHKPEELRIPIYISNGENGIDQFSKPSKSKDAANSAMSQEQLLQSFLPQIPFFTAPWPFSWTASQLSPPVTPATLFPPGFAVPPYPGAYWGCAASHTWNVPCLSRQWSPKDASSSSPSLGKHSREENVPKPNNSEGLDEHVIEKSKEKNLWVPKTLRVHDPRDAAKSSIWRTLGIQNDMADKIRGVQLFKGFVSKDEKINLRGTSPVLQANPAALSRSLNFHETAT